MAEFTSTLIADGAVNAILHVYFRSDGVDLVDEVLIDPKDLNPPCKRLRVDTMRYDFIGTSGRLRFDNGADDGFVWVLPVGASNKVSFKDFGGFPDVANWDGTGKVFFTTTGLASELTGEGSMIIKFRKKGV